MRSKVGATVVAFLFSFTGSVAVLTLDFRDRCRAESGQTVRVNTSDKQYSNRSPVRGLWTVARPLAVVRPDPKPDNNLTRREN